MLSQHNKSLIRSTLLTMSFIITLVIVIVTLISYTLVVTTLKTQALAQLEKYTLERGQRESALFQLAMDNQRTLRQAFLTRYEQSVSEVAAQARFEQLFEPWDDGTQRTRPELFYGEQDTDGGLSSGITGFVGRNVTLVSEHRQALVIVYDLLRTYGPAWHNRFQNLYIQVFDNMGMIYWPGVPWDLEAPADLDVTEGEWTYLADPEHNPDREVVWTGVYFDPVAQDWMVSCITPIDYQGTYIATLGSDVLLNELFARTIEDYMEGTYNLILREDGQIIAHPDYMHEIQQGEGKWEVSQTQDGHLTRVFQLVMQSNPQTAVVENVADEEYIAVTRIQGPDWYFITIYPQQLIVGTATRVARLVLILGFVSLLVEIALSYWMLRRQVVDPLQDFVNATHTIAEGDLTMSGASHLPLQRSDEIGALAQSFHHMAGELQTLFSRLQASEQKYRKLFEDAHDMISITTPQGRLLDINPAGERLLGYARAEMMELGVPDIYVHPEAREQFRQTLETHGAINNFETQMRRKNGEIRHVLLSATVQRAEDGSVTGFQTRVRDITNRKRAQQERERLLSQIQQQAQQVQHIIDTVPEGVLLLDHSQRIIMANPTAERYLPLLTDALPKDTLTQLGTQTIDTILAVPPSELWHEIETQGHSFQIVARPLEITPGVQGWVLVIRDMTRMRDFEQRIQQQEMLAAVGQLAAGIAHDINNVLATIVLYVQMTLREGDLPADIQRRMRIMDEQAQKGSNLIRQVLDFSRRSVLERRPLDLLSLFQEQVESLKHTLPDAIQVDLAYTDTSYIVNADPNRMQQMLMNLATNARDAMPQGGTLRIELTCVERVFRTSPLFRNGKPTPRTWVRITVADTGTGIPADVLPHIFEPFFTTKAPLGSGLGLAQVYGIVGVHDGHINVESEEGKGTTFIIHLPAYGPLEG